MVFKIALMIFVVSQLLMGNALATVEVDPANLNELSSERGVLLAKMKELDASKSHIATLQAERNAADDSVLLAQTKSHEARGNLEKKQKYDRENPGEITDKLREAEVQNKQATSALKLAKENLLNISRNLIAINATAAAQYQEFKRLQQRFESRLNALVETHLQLAVVKLQAAKVVEAKGMVSCGDDSMRVCKDKSKKEAEKNATEQGSIIDFSAFTEVKNFQLSKEVILSEVHASLSSGEILSQKIVDESSAVTVIRVKVEPVISLKLRHRITNGIRDDLLLKLGGRIDFSDVIDPSLDAVAATAQRRKEEQSRQDAASVEAELELQADDARRKSAQVKAESTQDMSNNWKWIVNAGINNNNYTARFVNAFNNKIARSNYLGTELGLTVANKDGYFVEISGTQGNGKHDLYTPASDQSFKRSSATVMVGGVPDTKRPKPIRIFLIARTATVQMAAIGQTYSQNTFTTMALGAGFGFDMPVSFGTFALDGYGMFSSAKWSDDSGYSATGNSMDVNGLKFSFTHLFAKWGGVTADFRYVSGVYKFNTFEVYEGNQAIGVSLFAKL